MRHAYARVRNQCSYLLGAAIYRINPVVDIVYLSASAKLLLNRLHDDAPVVLHYIGGDGLPVLRRLVDNGHIAYPAHCHVERTRNRGRRECQHIDSGEHLLEFLLVSHAETLLLVDYYKPEVLELDVVLNDTVRTYQDINAASLQPAEYLAVPPGSYAAKEARY